MGRSVNGASVRLKAGSEGMQPSAKGLNLSVEPGIRGLAERSSPFALDCIPSEPALSRAEAPLTERPIQFSSVQFSSVSSVQLPPHPLENPRRLSRNRIRIASGGRIGEVVPAPE